MSEQIVQKKKAALSYGVGVAQIIAGAPILLFSAVAILIGIFLLRQYTVPYIIMELIAIPIAIGGSLLLYNGVRTCSLVSVYQKIATVTKYKSFIGVPELTAATGLAQEALSSSIYTLIDYGYFPGAYIDLERKEFVLMGNVRPSAELRDGDTIYTVKKKIAPSAFLSVPFAIVVYIVARPVQSWFDVIAMAVLALCVLVYFSLKSARISYIEEKPYKAPKAPEPVPIQTGNGELDTLLTGALEYVSQMNELSLNITNEKVSKPTAELLDVSRQILAFVEKQPEKIRQIRQFMNYYLPTAVKLLASYRELSQQPHKGENIREAMEKIEGSMDGIVKTFHSELDSLYSDKAVDITVEVDVMLAMMRQQQSMADDFLNKDSK